MHAGCNYWNDSVIKDKSLDDSSPQSGKYTGLNFQVCIHSHGVLCAVHTHLIQ